eukprot:m.68710 g.68710  ORF g.68710 m.68710 type:complete len:145 (+) comp11992_c0_seq1:275-709(+)
MEGAVAVVTGAGSGIGRECAILLAEKGLLVVPLDYNSGNANETGAICEELYKKHNLGGKQTLKLGSVDVTNEQMVKTAMSRIVSYYGRLDVAVNCAGIEGAKAYLADMPETVFNKVMVVLLLIYNQGVLSFTTRTVLTYILEQL